jgi:membrane protein
MPHPLSDLPPLLRLIGQRFKEDRCLQVAASLTYTTLLSLVPIVTIVLTVFSALPVFGDMMAQIKLFLLSNMMPASAGKIISVYMTQFSEKAARLTAVGIALLGVTAFMLMQTIDHAFNVIWRVRRQRPWLQRFLIYWAVLTLGPLLVGASLSLTSYLVSLSLGWTQGIPLIGGLPLKLTPLALTIVALALLYLAVPNRTVRFSHALAAGIVAGILFELMKKLFALYLTQFPTYTLVYGAFAAVPIFLVWIYLSWLVVLLGAVMAAALPYWHHQIWRHESTPAFLFTNALIALQALYIARQGGESLKLAQLQDRLHVGLDESEELLERLEAARWVRRTAGNGWVLSCDPDNVRLSQLFAEFVFRTDAPLQLPADLLAGTKPWLAGIRAGTGGAADLSLKALCEARPSSS